jgi:16S rRNA (cytidine1402-2'-O)-methyltransferase
VKRGSLFVVATPIGNLKDITARGLDTLREVDLIACEDTRRTRILLQRWDIATRLLSLHRFSETRKTRLILDHLAAGKDVALVSDAGTPGICDPGDRLVRAALEGGFVVTPIPGPSSVAAAISVSGIEASSFVFLGFVPKKTEQRRRLFDALVYEKRAAVFMETALRIRATLLAAAGVMPSRRMVMLRELTKIHEEITTGTAESILAAIERVPAPRGEIVVVVEPALPSAAEMSVAEAVGILMTEGYSGKRLAEEAHERFGLKKTDAYAEFLAEKRGRRDREGENS